MYGLINSGLQDLLTWQKIRRTKRVRLSRRFKQRIFWRDGGRCVYCDKQLAFPEATMDHIIPLVKRGRNRSKENIVTACLKCNAAKGPLEQMVLDDDLTPTALWLKWDAAVKDVAKRQGRYGLRM